MLYNDIFNILFHLSHNHILSHLKAINKPKLLYNKHFNMQAIYNVGEWIKIYRKDITAYYLTKE